MIYITFGVVGSILTLMSHELSHVLVVWKAEGKVTEFKPWPHMYGGKFYFGRMAYEHNEPISDRVISFAPLLKALFFGCFWTSWGLLFHPLLVLAAWEFIDIINWLQGYLRKSNNDGGIFRRSSDE